MELPGNGIGAIPCLFFRTTGATLFIGRTGSPDAHEGIS